MLQFCNKCCVFYIIGSLRFVKLFGNTTKEAGESVKMKCEVTGDPPPIKIRWFKNEAPVIEEKGRLFTRRYNPQVTIVMHYCTMIGSCYTCFQFSRVCFSDTLTYQLLLVPCALFPFSCLRSYNAGKIQPLESLLNYSIKLSVLIYKKYVYRSRGMFGCNVILHGFVAN